MRRENFSTSTKGAISELVVAADLLDRGYSVFRSVSPNSPIDLVVLKSGRLQKVEVKTGKINPMDKSCWVKPRNEDWNILAVYSPETEQIVYYNKARSVLMYRNLGKASRFELTDDKFLQLMSISDI